MTGSFRVSRNTWWQVLLGGALAWLCSFGAAVYTQDPVLVPIVFIIGSMLVPFALLVLVISRATRWWLEGEGETALIPMRLLLAFAAGGGVGIWVAGAIEHFLIGALPGGYFVIVAVTEEVVKLAIVCVFAVGMAFYTRRDGMLLGVAVGAGFSAFETLGYSFEQVRIHGLGDVAAIVDMQISRNAMSPLGHSLWTALVAGGLFAAASSGHRLRLTWSVVGWLAVAIALHAGWDASSSFAAAIVASWYHLPLTTIEYRQGIVPATDHWQNLVMGAVRTAFLTVNAVIGLVLLRYQWRRGRREWETRTTSAVSQTS